jgi:hypothetical protein
MVQQITDAGKIDAAPLDTALASLGSRYGDTGRLLVHAFLVERALEFHQVTKNPLYLWEAYRYHRQRPSGPLPAEVTEYFDRVAAALLKGRGGVHKDASVFIAKALEMRHMGRGTVFDTTKDERDERIAIDMRGANDESPGLKHEHVIAAKRGVSTDTVRRAYKSYGLADETPRKSKK